MAKNQGSSWIKSHVSGLMKMGHGNDIVASRGITLDCVAMGVVAR